MWMLLGLIGLMMVGSVADAFIRFDSDGNENDNSEPEPPGGPGDEEQGSNGDMLDYQDTDEPPFDHDDQVDGGGDAPVNPNPAEGDAPSDDMSPGDDDWAGEWEDDEFISSDQPVPTPEPRLFELGENGGQLVGGDGDDTLNGGAGDDTLRGGGGNNLLRGGGGNDALHGGAGDDTLFGDSGDDVLYGGGGRNVLSGGDGNDLLVGGEHDDTLFGGAGDDTLMGGWGNDLLVAGTGSNLLNGGAGNDTLIGVHFNDNGADISGTNYLNGGEGDDLIVLGSGDIASGGNGADTFVLGDWLDSSAPAVIVDFSPGEDRLIIAYDGSVRSDPVIAIENDPEGGSSRILLQGEVIAILQGIDNLSQAAIDLQPIYPELTDATPPTET